jgi:Ca-activated chloride channel homolog
VSAFCEPLENGATQSPRPGRGRRTKNLLARVFDTTPLWTTVAVILLAALAELLHARRCGPVARLAFGPGGHPRKWTHIAPWLRVAAAGSLAWGLTTLLLIGPRAARSDRIPEGGYGHLVLALDVSPSMQLQDAGPAGKDTRAHRAGEVLMSLLQRIATDQVRISIVAFYTDAKPVVVDTYDLEVVKNALSELPLDLAFDVGKTALLQGVRQAAELARPWQPESTTIVVVSDGDTIPDSGTPELPRSVHRTLIVGVGDSRSGRFIDGHQSRQDISTLRQLAGRLRGDYFDANEKFLPSTLLAALAGSVPLRDTHEQGRRELALAAVGIGSFLLAFLPVALDLAGCAWHLDRRSRRTSPGARHGLSVPPLR